MIRELIDTELEAVAGGLFKLTCVPVHRRSSDCFGERERLQRLRYCCWWHGYRC